MVSHCANHHIFDKVCFSHFKKENTRWDIELNKADRKLGHGWAKATTFKLENSPRFSVLHVIILQK